MTSFLNILSVVVSGGLVLIGSFVFVVVALLIMTHLHKEKGYSRGVCLLFFAGCVTGITIFNAYIMQV